MYMSFQSFESKRTVLIKKINLGPNNNMDTSYSRLTLYLKKKIVMI